MRGYMRERILHPLSFQTTAMQQKKTNPAPVFMKTAHRFIFYPGKVKREPRQSAKTDIYWSSILIS